ncbi:MAG: excinuclease ABC subunit UvrC [Methanosarcinales archaeon]|jgi:excinuclease ABC subunit C|nr:excinuclease ABC subunit UvrC [Methanosarcinales archaeon]
MIELKTSNYLKEQLKALPQSQGIYLMKDKNQNIIYIGKAKSLKNRIRSYFSKGNHTYKSNLLSQHIADFDYIITNSEVEAFILEANLIKKHQPKFNIRLKDDKTYPFIKITNEDFPRIIKTRDVKNDGSQYFGPFTNIDALNKILGVLKDIFSYRSCKKSISNKKIKQSLSSKMDYKKTRACLNYHIDKCVGVCIGKVQQSEYQELIDKISLFLLGNNQELIDKIEEIMYNASKEQNFEKAARFRDSVYALKDIAHKQIVSFKENINQDIVSIARDEKESGIQLLCIRNGRLIGQNFYLMDNSYGESDSEILNSFFQQHYKIGAQIPCEILLSVRLNENQKNILVEWLESVKDIKSAKSIKTIKNAKNTKVKIFTQRRGIRKDLIEMSIKNGIENLKKSIIKRDYILNKNKESILQLKKYLNMDNVPSHIEGFDVSNVQGTDAVASMVVFKDGIPSKKEYRKFKIQSVKQIDDFAMIKEVIFRRYKKILDENKKLPDLILIDGGKGQLGAACSILKELGILNHTIKIIGLAKKEEEIFLYNKDLPLIIPKHSKALHLLQRVRDEAHRFALSFHRNLRSKRLTHSILDDISGIGKVKRNMLFKSFGSIEKIKSARIEELILVKGISIKNAKDIKKFLKDK